MTSETFRFSAIYLAFAVMVVFWVPLIPANGQNLAELKITEPQSTITVTAEATDDSRYGRRYAVLAPTRDQAREGAERLRAFIEGRLKEFDPTPADVLISEVTVVRASRESMQEIALSSAAGNRPAAEDLASNDPPSPAAPAVLFEAYFSARAKMTEGSTVAVFDEFLRAGKDSPFAELEIRESDAETESTLRDQELSASVLAMERARKKAEKLAKVYGMVVREPTEIREGEMTNWDGNGVTVKMEVTFEIE